MAKIGFVGLGHMGLPMACNLLKAKHQVSGFDLQTQAMEAFVKAGGKAVAQCQDLAASKDLLITMLQTGQQVKQTYCGEQGLLAKASAGTLFIDCSTIDVATARYLHQEAAQHGFEALDAPVSGGIAGAAAASLSFMVGGSKTAFDRASPFLTEMGKKIIYTGEAGSGHAAKICNNMVLGISMIAASEAFILAEHLGLSQEKLFEVLNHASGQSWAISHYVPVPGLLENVPANHDYKAGFTSAMMLKDLRLSQNAASNVQVTTPLGDLATKLYQQAQDEGLAELDFSSIIKLLEKR